MGWMETSVVEERMRFLIAAEKQEESFAALCRRFEVSRRWDTSGLRDLRTPALKACGIAPEPLCIIPRRLPRR